MRWNKIRISNGFLLLMAWMMYIDTQNIVLLWIMACILHEFGHILAISCMGNRVREISLTAIGAEIKTEHILDYRSEGIVAMCGPAVNLLLAVVYSVPDWGHIFSGINLILGILNLLPAMPLDGGRILFVIIAILLDASKAEQILNQFGRICSIALCLCGAAVVIVCRNLSLFLVALWMTYVHFKRKVYD